MLRVRDQKSSQNAYSLIELLLVLVIIGILAIVGVSSIAPKSPKATRAALLDLRNALQSARQVAISSGKTVRIQLVNSSGQWRIQVLDTGLVDTDPAAILSSDALSSKTMSYCRLASAFADLPTTSTVVTGLAPAVSYGFGPTATGWGHCLAGSTTFGFSTKGSTVLLTGASPNPTVGVLNGGLWVGVLGNANNISGLPYGVVLVTEQGQIVTYYKGDANLDDTTDHKWMRLG